MTKYLLGLFAFLYFTTTHAQGSLNFDGVDDYVQTTYGGVLGSNPRTIEAWIRTSNTSGTQQSIVDYGEFNSPNGRRFTLNTIGNPAKIRLEIRGWGVTGVSTINDGNWHHVAASFDGTTVSVYVDGLLEASAIPTTTVNTTTSVSHTPGVRIGNRSNINGTYASHFLGDIDEVRFWNQARSANEIFSNKDMELPINTPNLVGYWKLNSPAGSTAFDSSLAGNNGTLNNFALNNTGISDWSPNTTLPVEYVSFTAVSINRGVELSWITSSELNNYGFEVQRSHEGRLYETIGFVEGNGNSTERNRYQYLDQELQFDKYYYRLNQLDYDGRSSFSETVFINLDRDDNQPIRLYPNPVVNELNILNGALKSSAAIYNNQGSLMSTYSLENGNNRIDVASYPNGLYLIRILNQESHSVYKFIK